MDITALMQAVSSVGFPIVISLLAAWYIKYLGEEIISLSDKQNNQLDKMTDAITEVQKSLAALTYTIQRVEDDKR